MHNHAKFSKLSFLPKSRLAANVFIHSATKGLKFERIDKDNVVLLVVDHQVGLFQMTHDIQPDLFKNNIIAHAAIGKVFNLPTILTTSAETGLGGHHPFFIDLVLMRLWIGPNGPLPREITAMHPNAPHIKRNGEVNAWDNEEFRNAVKATGKTQIIIAGITTDVSIINLNIPFSTRDAHQR